MSTPQEKLARVQAALEAQEAVASVLAEAPTLAEVTPRLLGAIGESLGWALGALWSVDRRAGVLRCEQTWHAAGLGAEDFERFSLASTFAPGVGLPGRVWSRAEPQWIANVLEDEGFARVEVGAPAGLRSWFGLPIRRRDEVLGVIEFFSREEREPNQELLGRMGSFGNQIGQYIARRQAEEAALASEALQSAILESALDSVITMDHEGRVLEFNPAAERTFGYRREEVVGEEMAALIIPPALRERHRQALTRYVATREARLLNQRLELTGMRADGSEFPLELTITRIGLEGPPTFTGYVRDITERKAAERGNRLLAKSGELLSASLDYETTLSNVARVAVPDAADWCVVDLVQPSGWVERRVLAHVDPDGKRLDWETFERFAPETAHVAGPLEVIRTGKPELHEQVSDELLQAMSRDEEQSRLWRGLGVASAMVVPLIARGGTIGALTLVAAESGRRFDRTDLELARQLASRASLAIENARLYGERSHIAQTLQESLVPSQLPEIPGIEVAARFRAAGEGHEVGGDFYDVFETGEGGWTVVIGDVSGKGPEAAAVTALARYTLRTVAFEEDRPSDVLRRLNDVMLRRRSNDRFCTVAFARLKLDDEVVRLEVASAGHPLPLLRGADGTVKSVGEPGTLMGVTEDLRLFDRQVTLEPGDKAVFYTDGVTEARTEEGLLGLERLSDLLASCAELDAAETAERIEKAAVDGPDEPRDDVAVLVLRALGAPR